MNALALLILLTWVSVALFVEGVVVHYRVARGLKPAYHINTTLVWLWPVVSVALLFGAVFCIGLAVYDAIFKKDAS